MTIDLNDKHVLETFDRLSDLGIIHHGISRVVPIVDQGFPVSPSIGFISQVRVNITRMID
jgi:hypothetical protein